MITPLVQANDQPVQANDQPVQDNQHTLEEQNQLVNLRLTNQAYAQHQGSFGTRFPSFDTYRQQLPRYRLHLPTSYQSSRHSFPSTFTFPPNRAQFNAFGPSNNRLRAITSTAFHSLPSTSIPVQATLRSPMLSATIQAQPTYNLIHANQPPLNPPNPSPINRPMEMPLYMEPSLSFCDICGYASAKASHVKRHILRKHSQSKLLCCRCGKSFSTKEDLHRHETKTKKCISKTKKK